MASLQRHLKEVTAHREPSALLLKSKKASSSCVEKQAQDEAQEWSQKTGPKIGCAASGLSWGVRAPTIYDLRNCLPDPCHGACTPLDGMLIPQTLACEPHSLPHEECLLTSILSLDSAALSCRHCARSSPPGGLGVCIPSISTELHDCRHVPLLVSVTDAWPPPCRFTLPVQLGSRFFSVFTCLSVTGDR